MNYDLLSKSSFEGIANLIESLVQSSICLVVLDKQAIILSNNSRGKKMINQFDEVELRGKNFEDFLKQESKASFQNLLEDALNGARSSCVLKVKSDSSKGVAIEANAILISEDQQKPLVMLCLHHIDERNWIIEQKLKQRQEKIQLNQMDLLQEFAAGIAHEILNPLTIIKGQNELLKHRLEQDVQQANADKIKQSLQIVEDSVERAKKIIHNLSNFSKKSTAADLDDIKLIEVIQDTLSICESKFVRNQVKVEVDVNQDLKARGKKIELSQVLLNVFNNAFDVLVDKKGNRSIYIKAQSRNEYVMLSIVNNGPKIELDIAKQIMNPFFTTKDAGKGMGLGLSISSTLMQKQKGRIYYNPSADNTEFVLELLHA